MKSFFMSSDEITFSAVYERFCFTPCRSFTSILRKQLHQAAAREVRPPGHDQEPDKLADQANAEQHKQHKRNARLHRENMRRGLPVLTTWTSYELPAPVRRRFTLSLT